MATTRSMSGLTTSEVIRCLRDGTRDMTQVIYRQVPEMDIFDKKGSLRGDPLYRVNYCGRHCSAVGSCNGLHSWDDLPAHDHVLWCVGDDQLFRCRVAEKYHHWTGRIDIAKEHRAYGTILWDFRKIADLFDVAVPRKRVADFQVEVEQVRGYYALTLKRWDDQPFPEAQEYSKVFSTAWSKHVTTWNNGQEQIMARPQLYLTGLRR